MPIQRCRCAIEKETPGRSKTSLRTLKNGAKRSDSHDVPATLRLRFEGGAGARCVRERSSAHYRDVTTVA
jgi:hypothetical protein